MLSRAKIDSIVLSTATRGLNIAANKYHVCSVVARRTILTNPPDWCLQYMGAMPPHMVNKQSFNIGIQKFRLVGQPIGFYESSTILSSRTLSSHTHSVQYSFLSKVFQSASSF